MAFGSIVFLFLFLPVVVGCNWVMQERYRPAFITLASIVFFAFFSFSGVAVLIAIAIANFIFARLIVVAQSRNRLLLSRWVLAGGLLFDMALLAYFKWSGFIDPYINAIMHRDKGSPVAPFLMLVGMSFIVFSAVTYLVDVWRGDSKPGRLFDLIHYLFFFPKIVSGPIVRFQDFVRTRPRSENVIWGAQRVVLGLAKKVLIADNLGAVVNGTFYISQYGTDTTTYWIGLIAHSMQIYFDFAGYSDIAIGIAQMLGYPIAENFNNPYLSKSITEFWRRWHISLGAWFRNYLYIPLGGNRSGNVYLNLFIVFLATGIWHGATFNFVLWGLVFALVIIIEKYFRTHPLPFIIPAPIQWFLTFSIVTFNWVLFRAETLSDAIDFYRHLFGFHSEDILYGWQYTASPRDIAILIIALIGTFLIPRIPIVNKWGQTSRTAVGFTIQLAITTGLFVLCFIEIVASGSAPFLYFQF